MLKNISRSYEDFRQYGTSPVERYYVAGLIVGNLGSITYSNDIMIAAPLVVPYRSIIDRVGVRVLGGASGNARIGFYKATNTINLTPSILAAQSGEIDVSTTGFKIAQVNIVLDADTLYWATVLMSANSVAIRAVSPASAYPILGYDNTLDASVALSTGWSGSAPYGPLPPTFPSASVHTSTSGLPAIAYRLAA